MATLNDYLQQVQRFLRDGNQQLLIPADMISYINRARRETAMRAQCIRRLTPVSGAVITASVVAEGSGYTLGATVTISDPDFPSGTGANPGGSQATAAAIIQSGTFAAVNITYGGDGYFQPTASITADAGSGASVSLEVSEINQLNEGQEVYPFGDIDVTIFPGVQAVHSIRGVSVIYSKYRYSLPMYSFSVYQAMIRQYPSQYQYVPCFVSQFGQGTDGSLYMYPLPSQIYQVEYDCLCIPQDLLTNLSEEAIPSPWTDAVPYFAAALCYQELQNFNAARYYEEEFDKYLLRYSQYARISKMVNPYGRY